MDLFQRQWATYRAVLDHDLMEHQAMSLACGQVLRQVCATAQAPNLVDLGCGDLGLLAPLLQTLPLGHYTGLDLCAEVLPLAQAALSQAPFPRSWLAEDLLSWANAPQAEAVEVIHSSYAVHHLQQDQDKANWLKGCRRRITPGGRLIWVDVFRQAGESREAYLARYGGRVQGWSALGADQRQAVLAHIQRFDYPAERGVIEGIAQEAGWSWQWAWEGRHGAEAMAVLSPA
ncbi:class I SAM-dependent methyltransferase [Vulcanococcus sp. CPBay_Sum15L08_68]|uniref:class I SAM-dependent methyltransferase n=1 Tax=Vulcanococcus sp. CPBay_Sum15L08_68 TaxID=2806295 RepID=UPI0025E0B584|nr:class I SAM-dependent methyltransferase [Vulcanococcus sp. CPBay_Sum15L08_68]